MERKILAELLLTCWQRGFFFGINKDFMMKFTLVLCLSTTALAMPMGGNETWTAWAQGQTEDVVKPLYEVRDQVVQGWEWLQEFLPGKVSKYVEETAVDGQALVEDLYAETRDSLVEKTSDNVDDITGLVEGFIQKLTNIKDNTVEIVTDEEILSAQQIEARNVEEGLEGTKQKLKDLEQGQADGGGGVQGQQHHGRDQWGPEGCSERSIFHTEQGAERGFPCPERDS